jgi:subtilisin-like proprotein convertase family protein
VADPRRLLLAGLLSFVLLPGSAAGATRTYSTGPLRYPIPDTGTVDVPLRVLQKGPVSYLEVSVRIDHPRDSDLTLSLVSPTGSAVVLSAKRGGSGRNYGVGAPCGYGTTVFTDDGDLAIARGRAPFYEDEFRPERPLRLLYGSEASGVWKLRIADDRAGATGAVRCFKLLVSRSVVQTQTARAGRTAATLSYVERTGAFTSLRLRIVRGGVTVFDRPPKRLDPCVCPGNGPIVDQPGGALHVRDLDGDGEPEVVLDSYLGAPHCCWYTDVYRYLPRRGAYRPSVGFWGNLSARLVDLGPDGRPEFQTADNRFAYAFTSFAGSAFPIRIFRFDHGRFVDVTRRFPAAVRRDAAKLFRGYLAERRRPSGDVGGILPAWLADQYLLGRGPAGWPVLRRAVRRGELDAVERPRTYLRRVRSFLRHTGYIRPRAARRRP